MREANNTNEKITQKRNKTTKKRGGEKERKIVQGVSQAKQARRGCIRFVDKFSQHGDVGVKDVQGDHTTSTTKRDRETETQRERDRERDTHTRALAQIHRKQSSKYSAS